MAATSIPNIKNRLTIGLRRDLENDCLELPSLPDVAVAVTKALGDKASDASDIADIIQTDPAITAKLVKAANSAMYGHCRPVTTCTATVIRLGSALTHKLVMSLSVRELFTSSSPILLNRMRELWRHSTEIAAICYVLARYDTRFSPDQALLVGLLHDIGKSIDHTVEGSHAIVGADFARRHGETDQVVHAIRAHHGEEEPQSVTAHIVQAANEFSKARPGARRSSMQNFIRRLEDLESIGNSFDGVERTFAIQSGKEIRVLVDSGKITDDQSVMLSRDIARKIERELNYPGQIKVNVVRETRMVEHAR